MADDIDSRRTANGQSNMLTLGYWRMGGGTGGYRGYMYPPPFLEGGTRGYTLWKFVCIPLCGKWICTVL